MSLNVLITGSGRVAAALARRLADEGHRVTLIGDDAPLPQRIADLPPGVVVVQGDCRDPATLEGAGIRTVDVVAAVSADDAHNLAVSSLARLEFRVPRTIARIVDPEHAWLFGPATGVDVAVDQADLMTRLLVEEMSLGEVATLVKLRRGDFTLVEERVPASADAAGRRVDELVLPSSCIVVAIIREESVIVPRGDVRLLPGDEVLAVVHGQDSAEFARALADPGAIRPPWHDRTTSDPTGQSHEQDR